MKLATYILFFLFIYSGNVLSQPYIDIINLKYQNFLPVQYTNDDHKLGVNENYLNLNIPIPLKNKDVILAGGTFDQLRFSSSHGNKDLYALNLQLGYLKYWKNARWKTFFVVLPKISSDQLRINQGSFQQGGLLLFTYVKSPDLQFKFGSYYNKEFFGNFFMPLLGLEWKPSPRINIFGVLPGYMIIEYKASSKFYSGISYQCLTASYRLHDSEEYAYVRNGDKFWGQMQLKLFANFYFRKHIVVYGEFGHSLCRKYEVYNKNSQRIGHPILHKTKDGFIFNLGLALRFRQDTPSLNKQK
ncbi:DUF6268 family outer membrane beta-barrel protein [Sporocytophaga myxococcoides]|uniref:DUF6268 family outer membrane beta-barrel protein n=1 Tax=Sporocytophaga myxococcoides TaxID=153721 RepID=UPI0004077672|nr:DUF6268 family outer membrane beta-barrel protein [Sporocytophaga myxococcoides]